jgi:hypothetical protein
MTPFYRPDMEPSCMCTLMNWTSRAGEPGSGITRIHTMTDVDMRADDAAKALADSPGVYTANFKVPERNPHLGR